MSEPRFRPPDPFRCELRDEGDTAYLELHGELDLDTVGEVQGRLAELRAEGRRAVVLDLRGLTFIDSTGLRLVLESEAAARANGHRFAVIPGDGPVLRLFRLAGVDGHISLTDG